MSLLGVDVGTTGCKAAAFSKEGRCLGGAYREYPVLHPQDRWAELDSHQVMAYVREVIAGAAAQAATARDPVSALCVSSMGEAMAPVTRDRRILGPSILSSDIRGENFVARLRADIPQDAFYAINPNIYGPNYSLPKLMWVREHAPELYRRADLFMLWGDLVGFMLGGEAVTSYSLANRTLLFDLKAETWSDRLLVWGGIDRAKLADPRPSGTIIGAVSREVGAALGLAPGVAIVLGGHDQCCNSLGAGCGAAGGAVCGIGSYECITPAYDRIPPPDLMLKYGLNTEHHVLPGLYVSFIYNQAGLLVKWFRDTFAAADRRLLEPGRDIYDVLSAELPSAPTGLFVLPYFDMTGPPDFVTDASGVIAGLKTSTTRGDILKAIMEGVTFYFVDGLEALTEMGARTTEFFATGGGAKSDAWLQIKADIVGVPSSAALHGG